MYSLNLLYWDGGNEIRKENAKVSWNEAKKMTNYLKNKGVDISCHFFEFGDKFIFEDSIKINLTTEYQEKAKKNNIVLNHDVNRNTKLISIMDSDLFFIPDQYDELMNDITFLEKENNPEVGSSLFYVYNLYDIMENERPMLIENDEINYEKLKKMTSKFISRHSIGYGTLGGFFIVPTEKLKKINGFNEKFKTWGVEDDECMVRLKTVCVWNPREFKGPYHLYHPMDRNNKKFFIPPFTEEYFEVNKVRRDRLWQ